MRLRRIASPRHTIGFWLPGLARQPTPHIHPITPPRRSGTPSIPRKVPRTRVSLPRVPPSWHATSNP